MLFTTKPETKEAFRILQVFIRDEAGRTPVILDDGQPALMDGDYVRKDKANFLITPEMKHPNHHAAIGDYIVVTEGPRRFSTLVAKDIFEAGHVEHADHAPAPIHGSSKTPFANSLADDVEKISGRIGDIPAGEPEGYEPVTEQPADEPSDKRKKK